MSVPDRRAHWDSVYRTKREDEVSWFQASPSLSIDLIHATGVERHAFYQDCFGIDSPYDYDPVWQACIDLGVAPTFQGEMLMAIERACLIGLSDETYKQIDAEIQAAVEAAKSLPAPGITSKTEALAGPGSPEQAAGTDPTGQSGATSVSNWTTSVY